MPWRLTLILLIGLFQPKNKVGNPALGPFRIGQVN